MNKKQKELLLELICEKQIQMIVKDSKSYESKKYSELEQLKVAVKDTFDMVRGFACSEGGYSS